MARAIRIDSGYFVAAVEIEQERVTIAAPVLKYMRGWHERQVLLYVKKKGWDSSIIEASTGTRRFRSHDDGHPA